MKLEEVFDETAKSRTTIQQELRFANLLRCVGGQLKSYLNLTIGDNAQYSTLILPWWLVAVQTIKGLYQWTLIESKMPKEKVRRARMAIRKAKVKMLRAKERKESEIRKEKKMITRAKVKAKTKKAKVWQHVTLVENRDNMLHSWKTRTSC